MANDYLVSVMDYINDARTILLDTTNPPRYSDDDMLVALNVTLLEARRLRPDLFVYKHFNRVPSYSAVSGQPVPIEPQFRLPMVYGIVAHAMLRDEEDVPIDRANSFLAKFQSMLTGIMVGPSVPTRQTPPPGQNQ
jgi:hypothetical protein